MGRKEKRDRDTYPSILHILGRMPEGVLAVLVGALLLLAPPGGFAAPLTFGLDAPPARREEARIMVEQLARAGIRAELTIVEKSALIAAAGRGLRQAYLTDWGSSFFDPYDLAVPKLMSGGRGNFSFYANPRVDELLSLAGSNPDPLRRAAAYHEVQEIIAAQTPWIFGYALPRFEAVADTVLDYRPSLDSRVDLRDVSLVRGGELAVALDVDSFQTLDPAAYRGRETETVIRNLFDGLVTRTPEGEVVPELAASWERPDPVTYVFTLRRGPRFHDGEPVTAADVVFTFQRILNPYGIGGRSSPRRDLLGPLKQVEADGPGRVRFILDSPFPLFLQALVHFQIVSRRYHEEAGDRGYAGRPVGTGPFRYVSGTVAGGIVMERFAGYYGGSPDLPPVGPARLGRVVFLPLADADQRLAALRRNEVQIVQGIPIDQVPGMKAEKNIRLLEIEDTRSFQVELNNAAPPFDDIRARKAVSLAIDWPAVLAGAYGGYGRPLATCFLPSGFGFDDGLAPRGPDPAAARLLLDAMGFSTIPLRDRAGSGADSGSGEPGPATEKAGTEAGGPP